MSTLTRFPSTDSYKGTSMFPYWRVKASLKASICLLTLALNFFEQHKRTLISEGSQQGILLTESLRNEGRPQSSIDRVTYGELKMSLEKRAQQKVISLALRFGTMLGRE